MLLGFNSVDLLLFRLTEYTGSLTSCQRLTGGECGEWVWQGCPRASWARGTSGYPDPFWKILNNGSWTLNFLSAVGHNPA